LRAQCAHTAAIRPDLYLLPHPCHHTGLSHARNPGTDPRSQNGQPWCCEHRGIRLCETAAEILDPVAERLRAVLDRLHQAPEDRGEVYQLVYAFIRKGGNLPAHARWVEGKRRRK
jgi:hypothetical protein